MSRRTVGCLAAIGVVYLALGLAALLLVTSGGEDCPGQLRWVSRTYQPVGTPAPSPSLPEGEEPVVLGRTLIGLDARDVYGPRSALTTGETREPSTSIALDCGDGTYQAYRADR